MISKNTRKKQLFVRAGIALSLLILFSLGVSCSSTGPYDDSSDGDRTYGGSSDDDRTYGGDSSGGRLDSETCRQARVDLERLMTNYNQAVQTYGSSQYSDQIQDGLEEAEAEYKRRCT